MEFFLLIIVGFICGAFCGTVAEAKNRSGVAWFFAGFFFSLIALIAIAGMPVKEKK